jgi:hypothetical protein
MMAALDQVLALKEAFGPVGAVLLVLTILLAFFYRRDFLRKQNGLREAHERRDKRDELLIEVIQKNAAAFEGNRDALRELGANIKEAQRQQAHDFRELISEVRRG